MTSTEEIAETKITIGMLIKIVVGAAAILATLVTVVTRYNGLENRLSIIEDDHTKIELKLDAFNNMNTKLETILVELDWIKKNINK